MAQKEIEQANKTIKYHTAASVALGLLPLPLFDLAALTATQLNMMRKLSQIYKVEFSPDLGRSLLVAFLGSVAPLATAGLVKAVPVVGPFIGGLSASAFSGASTYAVGKVFVQHFESGGTLLTLDPEQVKEHYRKHFEAFGTQSSSDTEGGEGEFRGVKP